MQKQVLFNGKTTEIPLQLVMAEVKFPLRSAWANVPVEFFSPSNARREDDCDPDLKGAYVPLTDEVNDDSLLRGVFSAPGDSQWTTCDVFELRDAFDAVSTRDELIDFLRISGPFDVKARVGPSGLERIPLGVSWNSFKSWQEHFRTWRLDRKTTGSMGLVVKGLNSSGPDGNLSLRRTASGERLVFEHYCYSVLAAVAAAIKLDLLNGVQWRACLNCGTLVKLGLRPGQTYCTATCRETDRKRRYRERERLGVAKTQALTATAKLRKSMQQQSVGDRKKD